jgi:hypothetical protein
MPKIVSTNLRITPDELDALRGWAALRGRSLAQELRFCVRLYLRQQALAHLNSPEGKRTLAEQGRDLKTEKMMMQDSLAAVTKQAFGPYVQPDLRVGI